MSIFGATCTHGQLARSCNVCELEARVADLEIIVSMRTNARNQYASQVVALREAIGRTQRETAEDAKRKVAEQAATIERLEALFQQTHHVHWSWVDAATRNRSYARRWKALAAKMRIRIRVVYVAKEFVAARDRAAARRKAEELDLQLQKVQSDFGAMQARAERLEAFAQSILDGALAEYAAIYNQDVKDADDKLRAEARRALDGEGG
jgi:hypothetical protein